MAKTFEQLSDHIVVQSGTPADVEVSLYSIVRDEIFNLPAFFNHYRNLGVQQFLILDNGSMDGTLEFLNDQPDCVVLTSDLGFAIPEEVVLPTGLPIRRRWGILLKSLIPRRFLANKYALYADADEFLILPPRASNLPEVFATLKSHDIDCVAANLVEFYPETIFDIEGDAAPQSFRELISIYPYFDGHPLITIPEGEQPRALHGSASNRLFRRYRVGCTTLVDRLLRRAQPARKWPKVWSPIKKTPIVRWRNDVWLADSHKANATPTSSIILSLAHFKFTHDLYRKVSCAMKWKSHAGGAEIYFLYKELLEKMKMRKGGFLSAQSVAYAGPEQFEQIGLLKWDV